MKTYLVLLFFLISFSAFGQADLLTKKKGKYSYKGKAYKCIELRVVYKEHQESMDIFESGLRLERMANIGATLGVPMFIGGIAALKSGTRNNLRLGVVAIGSAILLEILSIIPRIVGDNKIRLARKTFNFEMIRRHGYNQKVSISFEETRSGLGLVLKF